MKKIVFLFAFIFLAVAFVNAQTKKIALESHSGKKAAFKIDGAGNYGDYELSPIDEAVMRRYEDSVRRADSIQKLAFPPHKETYQDEKKIPFQHYCDSARRADSIEKINEAKTPKLPLFPQKAKLTGAAASWGRPKKVVANH